MKSYELHLPVWKQGDDLSASIDAANGNVAEGFKNQAETYEMAASMCRKMASVAVEHKLEVYADTHHIGIDGPEDILEKLVKEDVLDTFDWPDEE